MSAHAGSAGPQPGIIRKKERRAELGLGAPRLGAPRDDNAPIWRSRGYLPHLDDVTKLQSITFRMADSLPRNKLEALEEELAHLPQDRQALERRKQIEQWLDAGMGCCALRHSAMAQVMEETLLHFDGIRYRLLAWCVMPNHVHVLIDPLMSLARIAGSWKSYTGRWGMQRNAELGLGVPGKAFWMREYWDRYIRDQKHYQAVVSYIHQNPVKAGFCRDASDWRWSSASCPGSAGPQPGTEPVKESYS